MQVPDTLSCAVLMYKPRPSSPSSPLTRSCASLPCLSVARRRLLSTYLVVSLFFVVAICVCVCVCVCLRCSPIPPATISHDACMNAEMLTGIFMSTYVDDQCVCVCVRVCVMPRLGARKGAQTEAEGCRHTCDTGKGDRSPHAHAHAH